MAAAYDWSAWADACDRTFAQRLPEYVRHHPGEHVGIDGDRAVVFGDVDMVEDYAMKERPVQIYAIPCSLDDAARGIEFLMPRGHALTELPE